MAMSLHLDDEQMSWLNHVDSPDSDAPPKSANLNSQPPVAQYPGTNTGRPESYRRAIARGRENIHVHKDSTSRLGAALQHLQIFENGPSVSSAGRDQAAKPSFTGNGGTSASAGSSGVAGGNTTLTTAPLPRKGVMPVLTQRLGFGSRSESLPPASSRKPTLVMPIDPHAKQRGDHHRKGSAPDSRLNLQQVKNPNERAFGTLLKSPTKSSTPSQPKRRTQFNPDGDEVDEQRWRFHRDELFKSMEIAKWAEASEHSDALAQISRDHGCVLSVNERYFFEKINGILLVSQRKSAAALRLAEKSNAENSNTLQLVKCIALMQLGDFKSAREACQPLFKIWSKDEVLKDQRTHYYLMAMILDRLGKKAEAKWYRQHIPETFKFDLWIDSALQGLQTELNGTRDLGQLLTEGLPRSPSPSAPLSSISNGPPPPTPNSTRSDPPPFTPSDPSPPEYQLSLPIPTTPRYTAQTALETLTGFDIRYEGGEVVGDDVAKRRAIHFFLSEYKGDKMYDCIRALLSDACCRGIIQVSENHSMSNSLGLVARNKGPASGEMARFLLSSGDQPYVLDSSPEGYSPLHVAAKEENFAVAEAILNYMGGMPVMMDVVSRNNLTPLHLAAEYNRKTLIVSLLLDSGADVNARGGPVGNTPLHFAIRGYLHDPMPSRLETIDYLLESPFIKLAQKNNNKETPEEYAKLCTLSDLATRIKDMRKNGKAIFRSRH